MNYGGDDYGDGNFDVPFLYAGSEALFRMGQHDHRHFVNLVPMSDDDKPIIFGVKPKVFESWHSVEDKKPYKIVRLDTGEDVPGEIVTASEITGKVSVHLNGQTKEIDFGANAIKIIKRGR